MAQARLSMRKIEEILRLANEVGLSNGQIAGSLNLSKTTVAKYRSQAGEEIPSGERRTKPSRPLPDFESVHLDLKKKGVTLKLLWEEYRQSHPEGYRYTQFCHYYRDWSRHLELSMRQTHKAGEKGFIDYSGMTVPVIDRHTGEVREAELFVFVLGASNYTYAVATETQSLPNWIHSHIQAFEYLGGVPKILVPDNLKSGVTRPCRYEPEINRTYQEMAAHYGCAVIPARVRKPKDKAKVETGVQVAQRSILAKLRDRQFFSLVEVNQAIRPLLEELNSRPMQKIGRSRREIFEEIEKPALLPVPANRYEMAEFRLARVNIDYHIEVEGHYYSVPYRYVHQRVDVRLTRNLVEVFHDGSRIASHIRSSQRQRHTTVPEHMPESHRRYAEWSPSRLIEWGKKNGESTGRLIEELLKGRTHPEQGFRSCLGVLRLARVFGEKRLEVACRKALILKAFSYKSVKKMLENKLESAPVPEEELPLLPRHENLRGNHYYGGNNHDARRDSQQDESDEVPCDGPVGPGEAGRSSTAGPLP